MGKLLTGYTCLACGRLFTFKVEEEEEEDIASNRVAIVMMADNMYSKFVSLDR